MRTHHHELPEDAVAIPDLRPLDSPERALGDFTVTPALLRLVVLAAVIGGAVAGVALGLLDLIGLITNLAYAGRWSTALTAPDPHALGLASVLVPVAGGLVVGLGGLLDPRVLGAGYGTIRAELAGKTWALLGMAAAMAGVMRSPLTSIVFALELTHDVGALLPLLLACGLAHLASVLALKRSTSPRRSPAAATTSAASTRSTRCRRCSCAT